MGLLNSVWIYVALAVLCTAFAGFASGMTVGLLSLDPILVKMTCEHGSQEQRDRALNVMRLVERHHLLLVTLLLANAVAAETLPVILDRIVPSWMAITISVTCILFFGEVLPQALCTGKRQLDIAAMSAPIVQVLLVIFYFIAWPIAKFLDLIFGYDGQTYYTRPYLKTLIRHHQREVRSLCNTDRASSNVPLCQDEVAVIQGALDLATKTLGQIMIPYNMLYMMEWNTIITAKVLRELMNTGHSRIPIYRRSPNNIRGLLLVKSLLLVDKNQGVCVGSLIQKAPLFAPSRTNAYDMLNTFQKGLSHMVFITEHFMDYRNATACNYDVPSYCTILGVATLEDIIEELIQEEIFDEFDSIGRKLHTVSQKETQGCDELFNGKRAVV